LASSFPQNLDSITNPNSNDPLSNPSHSEQHIIANTAIEALEAKVGVDGSTDTNSLDYKVSDIASQLAGLEVNNAVSILGLDGNNDLTVNEIENATTIDSLDTNIWRSANYEIQITKGSNVYSSLIKVLFLESNVSITESNILSTNGFENPANLDFGLSGSIMNLVVTPIAGSVSVRFIRTAIKK
jgi:hypothetical protein